MERKTVTDGDGYPLGYLVTFTTYGTWLHGDKAGSIWKNKPESNTILIGSEPRLETAEKRRLKNPPFVMHKNQRQQVLEALLEVCAFRKWDAYAIHVRTSHVHSVVCAPVKPEKIISDFKAYATRKLRAIATVTIPSKIWTRHGSTKYLWNREQLSDAVKYVRDQQGKTMAFGQSINTPSPDREGGDK